MLTGAVAWVYAVAAACVSCRILPLASGLLLVLSLPLVRPTRARKWSATPCANGPAPIPGAAWRGARGRPRPSARGAQAVDLLSFGWRTHGDPARVWPLKLYALSWHTGVGLAVAAGLCLCRMPPPALPAVVLSARDQLVSLWQTHMRPLPKLPPPALAGPPAPPPPPLPQPPALPAA